MKTSHTNKILNGVKINLWVSLTKSLI